MPPPPDPTQLTIRLLLGFFLAGFAVVVLVLWITS